MTRPRWAPLRAGRVSGRAWNVLDHVEAALGTGHIELARTLTDEAVDHFEERFGRLRRDVDRLAVADDTQVAALYLLVARAQLAGAEQLGSDTDSTTTARVFELSDRARALALAALLADGSDQTDDEQLILHWRTASAEWQAADERLDRAYATEAADDVAVRIADLSSAEAALVEVEADIEAQHATVPFDARPELPGLEHIQRALPPDTALVEYQLDNRQLLIWTITRTTANATLSRLPTGRIARLARAVQRSCANAPGPGKAHEARRHPPAGCPGRRRLPPADHRSIRPAARAALSGPADRQACPRRDPRPLLPASRGATTRCNRRRAACPPSGARRGRSRLRRRQPSLATPPAGRSRGSCRRRRHAPGASPDRSRRHGDRRPSRNGTS